MSAREPRAPRWIVRVSALVVPEHRRAAWCDQWRAELEHRRRQGASGWRLVRFALGAVPHAIYMRREEAAFRGVMADLRHSTASLLRRPGFSALTVATFAIGIGSATAIFSLAEALVLRPLPLEHADRLVRIHSTDSRQGRGRFSVSYPDYVDLTSRSDLFEAASFYVVRSRDASGGVEPERIGTVEVHRDFFQTLGSPTRLGRLFVSDDHRPANPRTAVVSAAFWSSRLAADSSVVGSTIRLDGVPHTVIGVVEDRFTWPAGTDVWTPLQWGGGVPDDVGVRSNHTWQVIARLRPGVEVREASEQIRVMARTIYARPGVDERDRGTEARAVPLHSSDAGEGAGALFATLGAAVFLVLLIACMNASGLLLVRAWSRARELSLRAALGAGRFRLIVILMAESVVLALVGGGVGIALGVVGLARAFRMAPGDVAALGDPSLNTPVVVAGLAISLFAAALAGLAPALRASRISVAESLKEGGTGRATPGRTATRLRRGLVVAEVAFSLTLLVGAGLTIRGFQRQLATDPGFDPSDLLTFTVRLPEARYGDDALVEAYHLEAVERLTRHPSIVAATVTSRLPMGAGGLSLGRAFTFDGAAPPPEGASFAAAWIEVDSDYFHALGIQPIEGRAFRPADRADSEPVAIVNERFARQMSPGESIVGRRIRSVYDENLPRTVVGVVPDIQIRGVSRAQRQTLVLVPRAQSVRRSMAYLVRTASDPSDLMPVVRRTMTEIDVDVAVDQLQSLRSAHAADLAGIRFLTTIFGVFGLLALVLAVCGLYGLISYSISLRRQEIGVRMAVGATAGKVLRSVLGESAVLGAIGTAIGLVLAYGAGRVLAVGMDGIAVVEASTYAAVVLLLGAAVLAATWMPATRATRIDPVEALRSE